MRPVPPLLRSGPFDRSTAASVGVSSRMLQGSRFVRVLPGVWAHRDHPMTGGDWVRAARLALPDRAHPTGITRLQMLGLDFGPPLPVRFVIAGDHHLAHEEVFLHRTKRLPSLDGVGVTPAAAFIAYCARARVVDAIKVGDWLLHHEHMSVESVRALALAELWRDGAHETIWVLDHLDGRARSLPESEVRAVLRFAGLPTAEVNVPVPTDAGVEVVGDLVYRAWRVVVEYEGGHHQEQRAQYVSDIDRYAVLRTADLAYVQVTKEKLRHARTLVGEVFRVLVSRGYDGPPPELGEHWRSLFLPLRAVVGPRHARLTRER